MSELTAADIAELKDGLDPHQWLVSRASDIAKVRAWKLTAAAIVLHSEIINALHDWREGKTTSENATRIIAECVNQEPRVHMLNTAFYWRRRLGRRHTDFADLLERLSWSRHSLVRVHVAFELKALRSEQDLELFRRLLRDRSKAVRNEIVTSIEMGRWRNVVGEAEAYAASEPEEKIRDRIARAAELVVKGFVTNIDEWGRQKVTWYVGEGRGGAFVVSSGVSADVTLPLMHYVREQEADYWSRNGELPLRPDGYAFRPKILWRWKPNDA